MRILVVDDSRGMRLLMTKVIKQAGFTTHTFEEAGSGLDALRQIEASPPNLVVSDWNMPEMNGLGLLKAIKEKNLQVKIGFITSDSSPAVKAQAEADGACFVIQKAQFNAELCLKVFGPLLS